MSDTETIQDDDQKEYIGRATYSPEDNKLRLYPDSRLPKDLYHRVRNAGFIWAPKQELFVAPMWTPYREDFLTQLCGEIEDEDTSLVDRAEERAERFEDYSEKREAEADRAHKTVEHISERFAGGQPILVGHHSEKRARRDAEKIDNNMRRALKLWETSKYWEDRAKGAIRHAKHKERPDVRHRRIKGLESDERKYNATITNSELQLGKWRRVASDLEAMQLANYDHISEDFTIARYPRPADCTEKHVYEGSQSLWGALDKHIINYQQAQALAIPHHEGIISSYNRWLAHTENRLKYERAMLAEDGGLAADKFNIEIGGQVLVRGKWSIVTKINKKDGRIVSVSTSSRGWPRVPGIEIITEYKAPEGDEAARVKAATALPPMCNYPGEGFIHITKAQWDAKYKDYKGSRIIEATATAGRHRIRSGMFGEGGVHKFQSAALFITDIKRTDAPPPTLTPEAAPKLPPVLPPEPRPLYVHPEPTAKDEKFDLLRDAVKAGVQAVSAPQLFPTPMALARRMVSLADIHSDMEVLEPSAGTGNILDALNESAARFNVTAVELNWNLAKMLTMKASRVHQTDFLTCNGDLGKFDRIVMNPPFANGDDIKHIKHALTMLKPGGLLVAICAGGPRQRDTLEPMANFWDPLPPGTFEESGTGVNTVLLTIQG